MTTHVDPKTASSQATFQLLLMGDSLRENSSGDFGSDGRSVSLGLLRLPPRAEEADTRAETETEANRQSVGRNSRRPTGSSRAESDHDY